MQNIHETVIATDTKVRVQKSQNDVIHPENKPNDSIYTQTILLYETDSCNARRHLYGASNRNKVTNSANRIYLND